MDQEEICQIILETARSEGVIGVDTESDSMHVYYERIALMQIAVGQVVYLVDTQSLGMPEEIVQIMEEPEITKVFQDMKFDLQLLKQQFDVDVQSPFDISIADRIIRESSESANMEKLILQYLGKRVTYSKKQQKSNWGKRPLSGKQLEYAAKDTIYLVPIMNKLRKILERDYRIHLFKLYMKNERPMVRERYYNPNYVYKLARKYELQGSEISRAYHLLIALDSTASRLNKPPHWLLPDHKVAKIVNKNPDFSEFKRLMYSKDKLVSFRVLIERELFDALNKDDQIDEEPSVGMNLRRWLYSGNEEKYSVGNSDDREIIHDWRRDIAKKLHILPEMIMKRKDIPRVSSSRDRIDGIFLCIPSDLQSLFWEDLQRIRKGLLSNIDIKDISQLLKRVM